MAASAEDRLEERELLGQMSYVSLRRILRSYYMTHANNDAQDVDLRRDGHDN